MKFKLYLSVLLLGVGLALYAKIFHTVWILSRIQFSGGLVSPRWVPLLCVMFAIAFVLVVSGWVMLRRWAIACAADKSIRTNKTIDRLYIRFGGRWLRRLDGSPWHGLRKFDAATARNILLATRQHSAFAEFMEWSPALAERIIAQAYECKSRRSIYRDVAKFPVEMSEHRAAVIDGAIAEAIEIYTPTIEAKPEPEKLPVTKWREVWAWQCTPEEEKRAWSRERCPRCNHAELFLRNNGAHLCECCDWCPELSRVVADEEQVERDPT